MTNSVVMEREFPHPPEKLWRALTQGPLLQEWLLKNDFQPVAGHKFQFRADPMPQWNGIVDCEVLVVEPNKKLSYNWNVGAGPHGLQTVVTFILTPTAGGVTLRMEQAGFRDDQAHNRKGAEYGWGKFLGALEKVLAGLA